jgi:hypothetical protein
VTSASGICTSKASGVPTAYRKSGEELARRPPAAKLIECFAHRWVMSPLKPRLLAVELPEVSTYERSASA